VSTNADDVSKEGAYWCTVGRFDVGDDEVLEGDLLLLDRDHGDNEVAGEGRVAHQPPAGLLGLGQVGLGLLLGDIAVPPGLGGQVVEPLQHGVVEGAEVAQELGEVLPGDDGVDEPLLGLILGVLIAWCTGDSVASECER
jgi:hypothetical protein